MHGRRGLSFTIRSMLLFIYERGQREANAPIQTIIQLHVAVLISAHMGNTNSVDSYSNDYELVIRSSKYLENSLTRLLPSNEATLMEKIVMLDECHPCPPADSVIAKMKQLVRWRNKLVHDIDCNTLGDCGTNRLKFRRDYEEVKRALQRMERPGNREVSSVESASMGAAELGVFGLLAIGAVAIAASAGNDDSSHRQQQEEERRRRLARGSGW